MTGLQMSGGWAAPCEPSAERQPQLPACSKTGGGQLATANNARSRTRCVYCFSFSFFPPSFFTAFFLPDFVVVVPPEK